MHSLALRACSATYVVCRDKPTTVIVTVVTLQFLQTRIDLICSFCYKTARAAADE